MKKRLTDLASASILDANSVRDLIVQNRRFLLFSNARMPNLASRCLSMALKAVPSLWEQAHGYKPLLAETFTDIEQFEGTCYKASNWSALGQTKGFKRHRADYYQHHGRPKKLWVYPFHPKACEILQSINLPKAYAKVLSQWMQTHLGTLPRALALDGKYVRD